MVAWLEELAQELGVSETPYLPVAQDFHPETCSYVVLVDRFTLKNAEGYPAGFQISAPSKNRVVSHEDLVAQVQVAIDIALGEHGFGDRFTTATPFTIVVVANDEAEVNAMQTDADLQAVVEPYKGRVVIDGFVPEAVYSAVTTAAE